MTEVVFKKENGIIVSGRVSGHSGYAEEGSDIVCASVSSVLWCILSGLESFLGDKIKVCQEDADVSFEIKGLTESEIETHPARHMITRAVGTEEDIEVDFYKVPLSDGDVILMCSDGLTNILSDNGIKKVLLPEGDLESAAEQFIRKANEGGGDDNTTVVLLKYTKNEEEEK